MQDEFYETFDLALAAALMCHNFPVEEIKSVYDQKTGKNKFCFMIRYSQKLKYSLDEFYRDDLLVRAKQYRNNVKDLKVRMSR